MTQKTILLVDDEEDIRSVVGMALADMGYRVLTAENGREGLRLFSEERPPIVVTDIKMPDIDGVDLLKKMKDEDPDTEVVMITGHGDMETAIESFQHEATDFITKPINVTDLEAALQRVEERISARERLREYTHSLEGMVYEKSEKLANLERLLEEGKEPRIRGVIERFQSLFDDLPCYVAVMDEQLVLTAINRKFRRDFGERCGETCYRVLKGVDERCPECPVIATLETGESREGEAEIIAPDGSSREVLVWTAPVRAASEAPTHVLALYTDMSQIQKVQDHLSSLGLMVGSISHSIKGMLTGLDGGMYMLDSGLRKDNHEQIQEGLSLVKQMVGRIRNMVLDVLLFSKDRDVKKEWTRVADFAEDAAKGVRPLLEEHGIAFEFECPENAGGFEVDAGLLRTALINVLENAVDACIEDEGARDRHRIALRVQPGREEVVLEVRDDGVGMDRETKERMCTLFFSSKGRKGTGLGLYITNRTVEQHGGAMEADSAPGLGTALRIRIPRRAPAAEAEAPDEGMPEESPGGRTPGEGGM